MNSQKLSTVMLSLLCLNLLACSAGGGGSDSRPLGPSVYFSMAMTGDNVVPMSVGACGVYGYENEPCISLTLCEPGSPTTCQTIDNILVDTGSYGLKVFNSLITINLPSLSAAAGGTLTNCTPYLDGSAHWGPVKSSFVKIGGLTTSVAIPIVALQGDWGDPDLCNADPSKPANPDSTPKEAGFNGIIGVGAFVEDCSVAVDGVNDCLANSANGTYFGCTGSSCVGSTAALNEQIANPVAKMTSHNNGVLLRLPAVSGSGAGAAHGYFVMGIGTETVTNNNVPGSAVKAFTISNQGLFKTQFTSKSGTPTYNYSFIDSGTNFLAFPQLPSLPYCYPGTDSTFFCPSSSVSLSAKMIAVGPLGVATTPTQSFSFNIASMITLASGSSRMNVYSNIAFGFEDGFDWGLPFFLGRDVYTGFKGSSATFSSGPVNGPFWAF